MSRRRLPTAAKWWWLRWLLPGVLGVPNPRARHACVRTNFMGGRRLQSDGWLAQPYARGGAPVA